MRTVIEGISTKVFDDLARRSGRSFILFVSVGSRLRERRSSDRKLVRRKAGRRRNLQRREKPEVEMSVMPVFYLGANQACSPKPTIFQDHWKELETDHEEGNSSDQMTYWLDVAVIPDCCLNEQEQARNAGHTQPQ